jgi:hypothetical protein
MTLGHDATSFHIPRVEGTVFTVQIDEVDGKIGNDFDDEWGREREMDAFDALLQTSGSLNAVLGKHGPSTDFHECRQVEA